MGGVDTFHSTPSRDTRHAQIRAELQAARKEFTETQSQSRKEDLRVSQELRSRRNAVLHGSQAARTRFCAAITEQLDSRRRRGHDEHGSHMKRNQSSLLPAPSTLTSIRADMSVVDNFRLQRAENPAWENFKASGLGWNPITAAAEYQLIPPTATVLAPSVSTVLPESPKSESLLDAGLL